MIDRIVGNYRIVEKVGEGGMGAVYRAVDLMLEREVAIKAIRPELAREPEIVERFRAEARMLARVSHPAIATIYSFFVDGEDLFLAMEFVRGQQLSRVLQAGPLPWERAVPLLAAALEGIEQAHRAGIVHRDLKSDNLMIGETGTVKVMDFGIARLVGSGRMTRTGLLIGTLRYMAPEQIQGAEVDRRTDVYALGTVLYEMVTGRVPFDAGSDYAVLKAQVEERPAPPSRAMPGLPVWLDQAILRALSKDPAHRFQTVEEMRLFLLGQRFDLADLTGAGIPGPTPAAALTPPLGTPASALPIGEQPTLARTPPPAAPPEDGTRLLAAAGTTEEKTAAADTAAASPAAAGTSSYREIGLPAGNRRRTVVGGVAAAVLGVALLAATLYWMHGRAGAERAIGIPAAEVSRRVAGQPALSTQNGAPTNGTGQPAAGGQPAVGSPAVAPPATAAPPTSMAPAAPAGGAGAGTGADRGRGRQRRGQTAQDGGAGGANATDDDVASQNGAKSANGQSGNGAANGGGNGTAVAKGAGGRTGGTADSGGDAAGGALPTAELASLGDDLNTGSSTLRESVSRILGQKEKAGAKLSPAEERLKDELKDFQEATARFRAQFQTGFFARARIRVGRISHGEDERAQIIRLARPVVAGDLRIDALLDEVKPDGAVRQSWRHLHHQAKRVAEICGLQPGAQ